MDRSFGGSRNRSGYLAKRNFSTGRDSSYSVVQLIVLIFKTGLHGTRTEDIREISSLIGTEIFLLC